MAPTRLPIVLRWYLYECQFSAQSLSALQPEKRLSFVSFLLIGECPININWNTHFPLPLSWAGSVWVSLKAKMCHTFIFIRVSLHAFAELSCACLPTYIQPTLLDVRSSGRFCCCRLLVRWLYAVFARTYPTFPPQDRGWGGGIGWKYDTGWFGAFVRLCECFTAEIRATPWWEAILVDIYAWMCRYNSVCASAIAAWMLFWKWIRTAKPQCCIPYGRSSLWFERDRRVTSFGADGQVRVVRSTVWYMHWGFAVDVDWAIWCCVAEFFCNHLIDCNYN